MTIAFSILKSNVILLLVLLLFQIPLSSGQVVIPFQLTPQNYISVSSVFNSTDTVNLMFHTGANEVSITQDAASFLLGNQISQETQSTSWGGKNNSEYFEHNSLNIGNLRWDSLTVWVNQLSGQGTSGKFGPSLFESKIIEVNFDRRFLRISKDLPTADVLTTYSRMSINLDRGLIFVEGRVGTGKSVIPHQFMIHTGYGSTILLDDEFSKVQKLGQLLATISEGELKDAYGNVIKTKKAILPSFEFGGVQFTDLPVNFFEGSIGNQKISVLGGEVLKRFNVIFDIQNKNIYLKPSELVNNNFERSNQ